MSFRESIFNIKVNNIDGCFLFNIYSREIIHFLDKNYDNYNFSNLQMKILVERGFYVSTNLSVEDEYINILKSIQSISDCLYIIFTITTKCDLRCNYCFENRENRISISKKIYNKSLIWLEKKLSTEKYSSLFLVIFGGEPLLEPTKIKKVLKNTRILCNKYGIYRYPTLLTTNGLLASEKLFKSLKKNGLDCLQISFDGNQEQTDRKRKRIKNSEKGVYKDTLLLLSKLSNQFKITIKLNFSSDNISTVNEFFEDIINLNNINLDNISIKPETIMISQFDERIEYNSYIYHPNDVGLANAFNYICKEANLRNLQIDTSAFFISPCMAYSGSSFLIEPNGKIKNCICAFGLDDFLITDLSKSINYNPPKYLNNNISILQNCIKSKCLFFPICIGGCPYERLLLNNSFNNILCRSQYFKAVIPVFVRQKWNDSKYKITFS